MSKFEVVKDENTFQVTLKNFKGELFTEVLKKIRGIEGRKYLVEKKRWEFPISIYKEFCQIFSDIPICEVKENQRQSIIKVKSDHLEIVADLSNSKEFAAFASEQVNNHMVIDFCFLVDILKIAKERSIAIAYEF